MFMRATSFNADISKWDVSSVNEMASMFSGATAFNADISKWNVLSVTSMQDMFMHAASFNRKLCGAAWVNSLANKNSMFLGSSGSISRPVCTTAAAFLSTADLEAAVNACLKLSPEGDCSTGPYGPISEWYVARVTEMAGIFANAHSFNGDISKWDVSRVSNMGYMFADAQLFRGDITKWDVSNVRDMSP